MRSCQFAIAIVTASGFVAERPNSLVYHGSDEDLFSDRIFEAVLPKDKRAFKTIIMDHKDTFNKLLAKGTLTSQDDSLCKIML